MTHETLKDGRSGIDSAIDAWASRHDLEKNTFSNLTYLTDVFHYRNSGETLFDQEYQPQRGPVITSKETNQRIDRIFKEGNTGERVYSSKGRVEYLKSSPHWADLTKNLENSFQTFNELVAEASLWLEEQGILKSGKLSKKDLKTEIKTLPEFQENYGANGSFRIEEYY